MTLAQVLADAREQADHLRRFGATAQADAVAGLLDQLQALPEFRSLTTWQSEANAADLSGNSPAWFRVRFAYFKRLGLAKQEGRGRFYSELLARAVARRSDLEAIHDEARDAAREDDAASPNGRLMMAVCAHIAERHFAEVQESHDIGFRRGLREDTVTLLDTPEGKKAVEAAHEAEPARR